MKKNKNKRKSMPSPQTDPLGSYTGVVTSPQGNPVPAKPTQDADDL